MKSLLKWKNEENIVIIGGAGGIGSATARKYVELGKNVIIGDKLRPPSGLLKDYPGRVKFFPLDVTSYGSIRVFIAKAREDFGNVTHLISMAGGTLDAELSRNLKELLPKTIRQSIELNLTSHLYLMQALLPIIENDRHQNKSIVLISSINAMRDYGAPAYSSAKAGLIGLVRSMVKYLGGKNIRINAVLPGTTATERLLKIISKDNLRRKIETMPLGRLADPKDIANVIYAFTDIMTCVTGICMEADCGQTSCGPTD